MIKLVFLQRYTAFLDPADTPRQITRYS